MKSINVYIKTLGCKVNLFDSNVMGEKLREYVGDRWKFNIVNEYLDANIVIINSCAVTSKAEKELGYWLRFYKKYNDNIKVIITGCCANLDSSKKINDMADLVITNDQKVRVVEKIIGVLDSVDEDKNVKLDIDEDDARILFGKACSERTRYFLKIQDGCNAFCSYCIIPYTRGKPRSVREDKILEEIKRIVATGINEIVLTGIHIGKYGIDTNSSLYELLTKIVEIKELKRLRLSSIEIHELGSNILELMKNSSKICEHLHIPLQSGSDKILKKMNRTYDRNYFYNKISEIRSYFPDMNIGTDVIVGFPEEDECDFNDTVSLIKDLNINYLHVFPYSARKGTVSYGFKDIDSRIKKERAKILRDLSNEQYLKYLGSNLGTIQEVLWEKDGVGCSRNYIDVFTNDQIKIGEINRVELISIDKTHKRLKGKVIR